MKNAYHYFLSIPTRWKDNDIFGHVNNVEYYSCVDTVITTFLIRVGGLDIHRGALVALCAESHCIFKREVSFPETIEAGLRVAHIGRSSVRYEIGLFREREEEPAAEAWFVHVFVGREDRTPQPLPTLLRDALQSIAIEQAS
jgi:acyl-CoA thioester hydrolase